jgi:hypothetical protein
MHFLIDIEFTRILDPFQQKDCRLIHHMQFQMIF